jgi:Acyl-CoA thioesterase C-terminal domain/Acyl-CoA thioesterase N-terminal domain
VKTESFFEPLGGGRYRSTEHTVGPWDPGAQHGGPPAALLARAIEAESPSWPASVVRVTVEILSAVPFAELTVRSRVLRPGRSVELVEAELESDGRPVMLAQAWRIRTAALDLPPLPSVEDTVPAFPAEEAPWPGRRGGYLDAMEWRPVGGVPAEPGPATIWGRMRYPLVPDEEPTGLQRLLIVADSGNGVSSVLPWTDWLFINPELTVHVAAVPEREWICLDAHTRIDARGFGLAASRLFDRERLVGRGAQSLYIARR